MRTTAPALVSAVFYPQLQPTLHDSRAQAFLPCKCLFFQASRQLSTSQAAIYYYDYFF